ncbi:MAG: hypothetical protein H2060_00560 [Azoarcus sp.]|nr:hypothetical protein [Azoarcus sp.]
MNADDDRELSEADRLLRRADALLQRHRVLEEDDDLPLVTDVVDDLPPEAAPTPRPDPAPAPRHDPAARIAQAERLVEIDTVVQRAVEAWVAAELPAIIERELSLAADRLHEETVAHLRATLLPRLSEHISERLGSATDPVTRG